jgi:UDP-N-acetylglucosamine:LPS N-acetylglucosamine transferase
VVVVTDATAHRLWIHPAIDRYVVFSAIAAGTVRQYAPRADVVVLPPAVRDAFLEAPDRDAARTSLGWPNHSTPVVLVMGGGWGRGPLGEIARALLAVGCDVTVLAGSNTTLVRQLGAGPGSGRRPSRAARAPRSEGKLRVLGPSDRVPELMAAADVVVTPPGQACHEARAVGRPLVLLDSVPGHGRENLLLELSKGGAVAARPEPAAVVAALSAVLDGAAVLEPWPCKAPGEWNGRFAEALAGLW